MRASVAEADDEQLVEFVETAGDAATAVTHARRAAALVIANNRRRRRQAGDRNRSTARLP